MSISVVLAEDATVCRAGIRALVESTLGFSVCAEVTTTEALLAAVRREQPSMLVVELYLDGFAVTDVIDSITNRHPDLRILVLSRKAETDDVLAAFEAGALGYLRKDAEPEQLLEAITTVAAGKRYLGHQAEQAVLDRFLEGLGSKPNHATPHRRGLLTRREREVLTLVADGMSTRAIAERLHISEKTVEAHRRSISRKLDIHNIAALTKYAIREGFSDLDS